MEIVMTTKQQDRKTETTELTETELNQVAGGIIAVLQQNPQMGDGSVRPVAAQSQHSTFGIFGI
jgi:bacteriocin-like protein